MEQSKSSHRDEVCHVRLPGYYQTADGTSQLVETSPEHLRALTGTSNDAAANAIFKSLVTACSDPMNLYGEAAMAFMQELEPQNALEAIVVSHITASHFAFSMAMAKASHAKGPEDAEGYSRIAARLSRALQQHIDTLLRMRQRRPTKTTIENVNVGQGGQAIVGEVNIHEK